MLSWILSACIHLLNVNSLVSWDYVSSWRDTWTSLPTLLWVQRLLDYYRISVIWIWSSGRSSPTEGTIGHLGPTLLLAMILRFCHLDKILLLINNINSPFITPFLINLSLFLDLCKCQTNLITFQIKIWGLITGKYILSYFYNFFQRHWAYTKPQNFVVTPYRQQARCPSSCL